MPSILASATVTPVRTASAGIAERSTSTRSARCIMIGLPYLARIASASILVSHRPARSRMPAAPCSTARARTWSPTPSASRARRALGHRDSPAPTSAISAARSSTSTRHPCRRKATAVANPPMPPPTMSASGMDSPFSGPLGEQLPRTLLRM
nr:hypothetical protein [Nocardia abscessus]